MTDYLVEAVVSRRDWGVIVDVRDAAQRGPPETLRVKVSAKSAPVLPEVGETWRFEGDTTRTPWGGQLTARVAARQVPSGRLAVAFLSRRVAGIGDERANRLWDAFGADLHAVLSNETNIPAIAAALAPDRPVLGPALAAAVVRTWRGSVDETRVMDWLARRGVTDVAAARTAALVLGSDAAARLEENPYILVSLLPWAKVDALGRKLLAEGGVPDPSVDARRFVGAVDAAVRELLADGDTAFADGGLERRLARILGLAPSSPRLVAAVTAGCRNGAIVAGENGWRAPGHAGMEEVVVNRLRSISLGEPGCPVTLPDGPGLRDAVQREADAARPLHPEQVEAAVRILSQPLACLQGGGGVGKIYLTRVVCDVWEAHGGDVLACALAGKAALRLSQAAGRLARTLARTLGELEERERIEGRLTSGELDPREKETLRARAASLARIGPETLVIVDEASMVDVATIHRLLRRMPPGCRLLLVGDEAQLPPIGPGLVYHAMVTDPTVTVRLHVVHRQAAETGIPAVAAAVRGRLVPVLPPYLGSAAGVSLLEVEAATVPDAVHDVVAGCGGSRGGVLVVCPLNKGPSGTEELNRRFHRVHVEATGLGEMKGFLGSWFSPGDPVMFLRNDYRRSLFNGLMGTVRRIDLDRGTCLIRFEGMRDEIELTRADLMDLSLAYAVTCHKAQGSQSPVVVIPLVRTHMLNPSWLYTAITRAERCVVLVGPRAILA